ncbi:hypothetical protein DSO57_1016996 [Entomophthora muscae]|uniref:Uncharacterized protein n=1 Tax=Entomophthora muscae TaxID=34485 RepID=A0ACC2RJE7_9FUNG|nr:hypothetical protein DSO57_1016996 [Entomophthora muscae]
MKITYRLHNSNIKVVAASSAKEFQSQGIPDTENVSDKDKEVEEVKATHPNNDMYPKNIEKVNYEDNEVEEDKAPHPNRDIDPKTNMILKVYITFDLPTTALATISIYFYLK